MSWIKKARAVGGLLAIVVLLGMIIVGFLDQGLRVTDRQMLLLASLISALLGVDVLMNQKSRLAAAFIAGIQAYLENSNSQEDDKQ